ncbi:response regulator [Azospirillum sp. SYSU D00513]|uniref:response regulator n=1 Tax=Azospirillum sp. SYSU D00513 TaxID=2812561 RepID=UPI001A97CB0E|nr:response regulator [Azospirillum sp. SYSU D00513]
MKHLIVADDDTTIALGFKLILEGAGYRVTAVHDGQAALEAFQADPADLILTDVRMPRMDGLELVRCVRGRYAPDLPVVIVSGSVDPDEIVVNRRAPPTAVLAKPVGVSEIVRAVRDLLQSAVEMAA